MVQDPSLQEVLEALDALKEIQRPEGDNEGAPINSPEVYDYLSSEDQSLVDEAEKLASSFTRAFNKYDEEVASNTNLGRLKRAGYDANLGPDQYEPMNLAGRVIIPPKLDEEGNETGEEWELNISDRRPQTFD